MRLKWAIIPLAFILIAAFDDELYAASPLHGVPHGWAMFFLGYGILLPVLVMSVIDGGKLKILDEMGLTKNPWPALAFAVLATSPALIGFALKAQLSAQLKDTDIIWGGLFFPFVEEAFFRGFLFGQLYQRARWGFWPAALVPAVLFAAAHFGQAHEPMEIAGILAITGIGAIVFSFLFVQWDGNIWAPFGCHAALNILWSVFNVDDTALGDTYANILRFGSIALALGLCYLGVRLGWLKPLQRAGAAAGA
jgi:membrane protease YdiL (CAAX protease family)